MTPEVMKMLAIGLAVGLGMWGPALALGLIGFSAFGHFPQSRSQRPYSDQHDSDWCLCRSHRYLCPDYRHHSGDGCLVNNKK